MLRTMPRAPSIDPDDSNGLVIAWCAAVSARPSPEATPTPMIADPASCMIVRTSAKSVLMSPGMLMRSVIPFTPCNKMLSAILKASTIVVLESASVSSRSFGMTIIVSTCSRSRSIPCSACIARRRPSKANGFVTIATVSAPRSRATSATTGAPPVPVPPPSPAAMNTMSAPFRASPISTE